MSIRHSYALIFSVFILLFRTTHGVFHIYIKKQTTGPVLVVCKYGKTLWPPYVLRDPNAQTWTISPNGKADFSCVICLEDEDKVKYGHFVLYDNEALPPPDSICKVGSLKYCIWLVNTSSLSLFNKQSTKYDIKYQLDSPESSFTMEEVGNSKNGGPFGKEAEAAECKNFLSKQKQSGPKE